MDIKNVPQDNISSYAKNKKAVYATNEKGEYKIVSSSGWEVESIVTQQALKTLNEQADVAYLMVEQGLQSPLYYHMFAQRMDLSLLSQSTGLFQWRIKRHFNPARFSKLSEKKLSIYSEALGVEIDDLKQLPAKRKK